MNLATTISHLVTPTKTANYNKKKLGKVVVVGLGYVGLPLALLADRKKWQVYAVDIDKEKVDQINNKISPINDEALEEQLQNSHLKASTDFSAVTGVDVIVICVPTPIDKNRLPDLRSVIGACTSIAPFLSRGQLIVLESTVNPGICDDIVLPILEKESGLKAGTGFYLAHCPERIDPGNVLWNVENLPRVVGSLEEKGLNKALKFYRSIINADIKPMGSLKEAEAVKVVENCFRDVNIAFVNELAMSFKKLDIDLVKVIEGASSKPFAFMPHYPGCGVGGHCIPVDPYYLIDYAKQNGFHHEFLTLARKINSNMPRYVVDLLVSELRTKNLILAGSKITVLGLAYKSNIEDDRESPSYEIIEQLEKLGAQVTTYDPYVKKANTDNLSSALDQSVAVVIATAHSKFHQLTPKDFTAAGVKIVIDGRNCLNKDLFTKAGFPYHGVGR